MQKSNSEVRLRETRDISVTWCIPTWAFLYCLLKNSYSWMTVCHGQIFFCIFGAEEFSSWAIRMDNEESRSSFPQMRSIQLCKANYTKSSIWISWQIQLSPQHLCTTYLGACSPYITGVWISVGSVTLLSISMVGMNVDVLPSAMTYKTKKCFFLIILLHTLVECT